MSVRGCLLGIVKFAAHVCLLMLVGAASTFLALRFFTTGDETVVPDLTGRDAVEAIQQLNRGGLQLRILPQKRFHDKIPADKIVSQTPPPGTHIKQGRSVEVYLSLGPEKVTVPDLVGQTTRVAGITLDQMQLQPGRIIYVSIPGVRPDEIIAQFPVAGTTVTDVRTVDLLANGMLAATTYVMPDLIGKSGTEVTDYLRDAGFHVGTPQPIDYPGISPGTVVKQAPPAGYKVSKDTVINIYISK